MRRWVICLVCLISQFLCVITAANGAPLATETTDAYQIGPGDILDIAVWKNEPLSRTIVVLPDGTISFPLLGRIEVAGKSVSTLQEIMEKKITKFMPDPVLTVSVQQVNSLFVYAIGKVLKPGRFLLNADINVLQLLSLAGGMNTFAKRDSIKIYRQEADGQTQIYHFDYDEVTEKDMLNQNIFLQRGDIIVVP